MQRKAYCDDGPGSFRGGYGDRAANLTHEDRDVVGAMFFGIWFEYSSFMPTPSSVTVSSIWSSTLSALNRMRPVPCGKACLMALVRQFIDQKAKRYGTNRVDLQRPGLDLDLDARGAFKQAIRHGPGDFPQICVQRDRPGRRWIAIPDRKARRWLRCAPAWLGSHQRTGPAPIWPRSDQGDDDLQVILDPVGHLVGQHQGVALALLALADFGVQSDVQGGGVGGDLMQAQRTEHQRLVHRQRLFLGRRGFDHLNDDPAVRSSAITGHIA